MNASKNENLRNSHFFLYGPPGSGKSTLGRRLAESLALPFYDLDEVVEMQARQRIPQIFAAEGESGFRRREAAALAWVLEQPSGVVALGGGALLDPENRLKAETAGKILCLSAPTDILFSRLQYEALGRPLIAGGAAELEALLELRRAHYASFPLQLDTSAGGLEAMVEEAQIRLGAFHISGMGAGYDIRVRPGALDCLGEELRRRGLQGPIAIVTDETVEKLYAQRALQSLQRQGYQAESVVLPVGEPYKTVATVICLWETFLDMGLERGSTVVSLGGGVVGDIAGFAAATYLRGVAWVYVPTTLLAMVDSSLGGKTGVDLPQGKNLVGAFHAPRLVLTDPQVLSTLPEQEMRNGLAEVVKHAVIADPQLFRLCQDDLARLQADWAAVVSRALAVKKRIILEDPYESGPRALLNLGHTVGHALERATDFQIRHGEAVSIGLVSEARLAERIGLAESGLAQAIAAVLAGLGLPTELPRDLDRQRLLQVMQHDKKRQQAKVRFTLPVRIGEVRWGVEVSDLSLLFDL